MTDHKDVRLNRRVFLGGGVGSAALALGGCGFSDSGASSSADDDSASAENGGPSGSVRIVFTHGAIDSLDPHYVNNAMLVVPAGLLEGLVFANDDSTDVVPAAAESWEVSEDQTVYTFQMRQGATWSNGDPVVAGDAEWSFRRLLTPTGAGTDYTSGASSYLTGLGIAGAEDFMTGATDDWESVGISAPDDDTLVVELEAPNADFLITMSHYSMVLVHPPSLEDGGQEWMQPENWVGNGAFVPQVWEPTTSLQMVANESYWDYENVGVETIDMVLGMDATASLAAFSTGELDISVANATTIEQREELQEDVVQVDGYGMLYMTRMWGGHPALTDARVRRALSMAIDREAIAAVLSGQVAGTALIPGNSVPGWDESIAIAYDVDGARDLMAEAGLDQVPDLRVQFSYEDPWLPVLADQWEDAFDTNVTIDILEPGVYSETNSQPYDDESTMSLFGGTFAGIPTMSNWVNNIFGPDYVLTRSLAADDWLEYQELEADEDMDGAQKAAALESFLREHADPDAIRFSDLAVEARGTIDDNERLEKFLEAARIREEMAYTIPLSWRPRTMVVADHVSGFVLRSSPEIAYYKYITVDE